MKLEKTFSAKLQQSRSKGGWTYVAWPRSVKFLEPVAWSRLEAKSMGSPFGVRLWHWVMGHTNYL